MEGYDLVVNGHSFVKEYGSGVVSYERPSYETKSVPTNDWLDREGEETVFPEGGLVGKGGDLKVKMCYVGKFQSWDSMYAKIVDFLKGSILELTDAFSGRVYHECYFKGLSDEDVWCDASAGDVVSYTLNFRVTKLREDVA